MDRCRESESVVTGGTAAQGTDRQGARILIVDGETDVRLALAKILMKEHYDVEGTASLVEALDLVEARPFDLVITDVGAGGEEGLALAGKLNEINPGLKVVLITAMVGRGAYDDAITSGSVDFVLKPARKAQILSVVRAALAGARTTELGETGGS